MSAFCCCCCGGTPYRVDLLVLSCFGLLAYQLFVVAVAGAPIVFGRGEGGRGEGGVQTFGLHLRKVRLVLFRFLRMSAPLC